MEILFVLLVLLAVTRIFGELAERVGQPALVGELMGGILIGAVVHYAPGTFPAFSGLTDDEAFVAITDLGVFFLMLLAGIEMQPRELTRGSGRSFGVAIGGMVLPLAAGCLLGWFFVPESPYRFAQILFLGTALAITAVPVAVKILIDLDQLDSRAGQTIVAAAIFDDILSLILLAALTAVIETGELFGLGQLGILVGKITLFFVVVTLVGRVVLPRLEPLVKRLVGAELEFSLLLLVALGFAVLAEVLGMHFIIGAFAAGLFFSSRALTPEIYEDVEQKISGLTKGFLAPIFFASIGLHLDLSAVAAVPGFVVLLVGIALLGKLVGSAAPALASGLTNRESMVVGVGMSARGAVELIIAGVALQAGLFTRPEPIPPLVEHMFSAVVIMAIVTTLVTPVGLRWLLPRDDDTGPESKEGASNDGDASNDPAGAA